MARELEQLPETLPDSPMPLVCKWLADAKKDGQFPNPDAMTLATVNKDGAPSARIVLCKAVIEDPGYLVFYTNYESAKSKDIGENNRVAAVFHWDHLNRQVRVEGICRRSPDEESDQYFASRDKESQIGAWASAQSRPLKRRQDLKDRHVATARKLAELQMESNRTTIPRPSFWGGYKLWIDVVELWCRGTARLHDRGRWTRKLQPSSDGSLGFDAWQKTRLQP